MQRPNACRPITEIDGVVRRVDPIGREVELHAEGVAINLDIPPNCVITLRGERVKLRLIQPRDRVRVKYVEHFGTWVADAIEVQPGGPAPA